MNVKLEVSFGELVDRITILEIKRSRLPSGATPELEVQLAVARSAWERAITPSDALARLSEQLSAVNLQLWEVEEELRACEKAGRFDAGFVELARSVYKKNDLRAALKRRIDELLGSRFYEQKSYSLPEV